MSVYVDNARIKFGRMLMCHMIADTEEELHDMADKIGVARKWHQSAGTYRSHYDICLSKRNEAFKHGAIPIDRRLLAEILNLKRLEGVSHHEKTEGQKATHRVCGRVSVRDNRGSS